MSANQNKTYGPLNLDLEPSTFKKTMPCYLCGQETETYVVDCGQRGPYGECYFKKKVPLCEGCFRELYPSRENIQKLSFWLHIFPSIEKVQTT